MRAIEALRQYFGGAQEVAAAYLYGTYAADRSYPDTDFEVALLFRSSLGDDEIASAMERLGDDNPLGGEPGILMPFALNTHILPVVYEVLLAGTLLVDNDPEEREAFTRAAHARVNRERAKLLEESKETIEQARALGVGLALVPGGFLRPPSALDPLRSGWRLGRVLTSLAVLEVGTRDAEEAVKDPDRLSQLLGWFNNAAGAATGIAKAMLTTFGIPRPARRWEIFLPLAGYGVIPTELALHLGAMVETRWALLTQAQIVSPEQVMATVRGYLPHIVTFARVAAWITELPGAASDHKLH